jgi:hypothetical protein
VSKAIDKAATPDAERWQGWGTALKPAFEPIVVARKPLTGTVAANVLTHRTGALNIDGCRIAGDAVAAHHGTKGGEINFTRGGSGGYQPGDAGTILNTAGRWPANVILDESQAGALDQQSGRLSSGGGDRGATSRDGLMGADSDRGRAKTYERAADSGGASRFFYVAKAPKKERPNVDGVAHPTVKPLTLMRWLVRLVTPPGGTVLDPFGGSGATAEAAMLEDVACIIVERELDYLPLIRERVLRNL